MLSDITGDYRSQELRLIARWIDEVNDANGFDRPTWETIPSKLMFVISELDEAMQAVDGTGEHPLEVELADTAIRILSILNSVFETFGDPTTTVLKIAPHNVFVPAQVMLWKIIRPLCQALEHWRHARRLETRVALEIALKKTWSLSVKLGFNIGSDIFAKVRKNQTRGLLHGKVYSAG